MARSVLVDLVGRLLEMDASGLSDADKTLAVADPGCPMVPDVRMAGPAFTVVAADDHLRC